MNTSAAAHGVHRMNIQLDENMPAATWSQSMTTSHGSSAMRLQIATASKRNVRYRPFAFTEHGAIMAASVLNTPRAIEVSVYVVRAFVKLREYIAAHGELARRRSRRQRRGIHSRAPFAERLACWADHGVVPSPFPRALPGAGRTQPLRGKRRRRRKNHNRLAGHRLDTVQHQSVHPAEPSRAPRGTAATRHA